MTKNPEEEQEQSEAVEIEDAGAAAEEETPEARIARLEIALTELNESYLRSQAELQNVLKRHTRELSDRARYAAEGLARDLLEVIDNLDRALQHAGQRGEGGEGGDASAELSSITEGVGLVRQGLISALERHGISRLEAHGQPFDPGEHDAVAMIESAEHEPNTVVDEHRPGYRIHDRLLRPAMVAVSKAPAAEEPENK
jgi:molecular chaperone GrpE